MWNGTMFVDLDWPLNASSLLSASAEFLVCFGTGRVSVMWRVLSHGQDAAWSTVSGSAAERQGNRETLYLPTDSHTLFYIFSFLTLFIDDELSAISLYVFLPIFPSVLWPCWLGDRKGIRPVKKTGCWYVGGDTLTGTLHVLYSFSCYHHLHHP